MIATPGIHVPGIHVIDHEQIEQSSFRHHFADAVILTKDRQLLLQQRPMTWRSAPGCLTTFGGHVEANESVIESLLRELKEELGAQPKAEEIVTLGAITEAAAGYRDLVHLHFWSDDFRTITGCYEAEAVCYTSAALALDHPRIMPYVRWGLMECIRRRLIR